MNDIIVSLHYRPLYARLTQEHVYRYIVFYGGRGGGKSWAIALALLTLCSSLKLRVLCAREIQISIQDSVHKLLKDYIGRIEAFSKFFYITKTSIIGLNGSEFIFKGVSHDPMQIKSLEAIDICWVEEAQKVSEESWNILIPTIRKGQSQFFITFNPHLEDDPTYKRFITNTPPNTYIQKVNFRDNPHFPKELKREMEYLKQVDHDLYLHVWEGYPRTITNAQIFKNKFEVKDFDIEDVVKDGEAIFLYGLDWGFSNDPLATLRAIIFEDCLYIDYEAGGVGIELDHTKDFIDMIPGAKENTIRADSARPESISFVKRQGYNIVSVDKWGGSVEDGIEYIRTFIKVYIHPRCKETANEFVKYSYKENKITGEILSTPLDKYNHYIDALRYALAPYIKNRLGGNVTTSEKKSFIKSDKFRGYQTKNCIL